MVAYNFQARFAPLVQAGVKTQTIRAVGKRRHARAGEKLQLYTAMRTKQCRKLLDAVCSLVCPVDIEARGFNVWDYDFRRSILNADDFARRDGFDDYAAMVAFFESAHGLPFTGLLISWR